MACGLARIKIDAELELGRHSVNSGQRSQSCPNVRRRPSSSSAQRAVKDTWYDTWRCAFAISYISLHVEVVPFSLSIPYAPTMMTTDRSKQVNRKASLVWRP